VELSALCSLSGCCDVWFNISCAVEQCVVSDCIERWTVMSDCDIVVRLTCIQVEELQIELANKEDSDPVSCSLASAVFICCYSAMLARSHSTLSRTHFTRSALADWHELLLLPAVVHTSEQLDPCSCTRLHQLTGMSKHCLPVAQNSFYDRNMSTKVILLTFTFHFF